MRFSPKTLTSLVAILLIVVANLYIFQNLGLRADGLSRVYFLDVGQGDGILIRTADGENILIDGGPNDSVVDSLNRYLPITDRALDLVLLTHAHADHATGLLAVAKQFPIKSFWYSGADYESKIYADVLAEIAIQEVGINLANAGDVFDLMRGRLDVLYPPTEHPTNSDPNDTSIVASLHLLDFDLLLTGDINADSERQLVATNAVKDVEVLKVAHHGSRTSSSQEFIDATSPELAVVSLGAENTYGHPHPETLEKFKSRNIPLLRTDQHGTIWVITDGYKFKANTSR